MCIGTGLRVQHLLPYIDQWDSPGYSDLPSSFYIRYSCISGRRLLSCIFILFSTTGGPAYYVLHPKKRYLHFFKLTRPGLQKPGRNFFLKNSCWVIKDQGILNSQNNLDKFIDWWYKAIVHTFCFFLLVSWFNVMGICFNIW